MAQGSRTEQSGKGVESVFREILDELPVDRLKDELQEALSAAAAHAADLAAEKISDLTGRLTDVAANGGVAGKAMLEGGKAAATGGSPLLGALKGGVMGAKDKAMEALGGGSGGSGGKANPLKATTIIESVDVGVPIDIVYDQWTQFQDFSGFMKKVERVEQKSDEKLDFKAKILWSHRTWEATILEQVPEDRIVWRSKGKKGHVDGTVTFHELAPNLTRVLIVLEYYPQGLFERVGNIWRAQGRRARVELKHFQRHVMVNVIQHPDEVEGWHGEIHGGRVDQGNGEDADEVDEDGGDEEYDEDEYDEGDEDEVEGGDGEEDQDDLAEDEYDEDDDYDDESDEDEDEYDDEEPADEYDEDEDEDEEYEDDEDYDDEDEYEDDEGEGDDEEYDEEYDEEPERPRRRAS
ncbi:SRPBCC family protein [Kribbella sp. NPDC059898]|uniref:SRPBCC family protein n=1 Tax=Kribbella sp. NPDC059898 TaxID=3346995 RepID=UPI00365A72B3